MNLRRKLKYAAILIMAALCFILAGCGATVDTNFSADGNFSGKRVITLTLSESDLQEYIKGGKIAIDSTVKKYKPDELSYSSKNSGGDLVCEFTLEFNGIEDYRTKVASVFAANPDNDFQCEIEYENIDSPFKSSLSFKENFNSIDMLGWLTYGLQKDDIVDYSTTSSWYETGSTALVLNGKEYSTGSNLNMSDSESNCADEVTVKTYFDASGKIQRSFTFGFNENTVNTLNEKGTSLEEYFSALAGSSASYRSETDEDYGRINYIIDLGELSAEDISAKTAQILLDEEISFGTSISASEGAMNITVTEKINASAYLRRSSGYLQCIYYMPDGTEMSNDGSVYANRYNDRDGNTYFSYYPDGEESVAVFKWAPRFEKYEVNMGLSGDSLNLSLKLSASETMHETARSILKEKLQNSVSDGMKLSDFSSDGFSGCEIKFDSKDMAENYKNFVSYYTGRSAELKFTSLPASSGSPFVTQNLYSIYLDVRPISDNNPVEITFDKPLGKTIRLTEGSFDPNEENPTFTGSLSIVLVAEEVNILAIIIAIFAATAFIGFVILVLANLKTWISEIKSASAAARAKAAERAAAVQAAAPAPAPVSVQLSPENTAAPVSANTSPAEIGTNIQQPAANVSENVAEAKADNNEEEELI